MGYKGKRIKISQDTLLYFTLLYIYLPIIIFLLTWTNLLIATPVLVFSMIALYRFVVDQYYLKEEEKEEKISIHIFACIFFAAIVFVFGYYMGFSGDVPQAGDWSKHNAILRDLIEYEWPVYYQKGEKSMLAYYIAQYILPAFVAKVCHASFAVGQYTMYVWNCIGILLIIFWLFVITKAENLRKQITAAIVFLFFGGMLPVAQILLTGWNGTLMQGQIDLLHFVNLDEVVLQYRSNLTAMRWVFPQCIVPWLTILLFLYRTENRKHYVTILLPGFLYGTLSFLGTVFIVVSYTIVEFFRKKQYGKYLREIFSIWNIGMLLTLGSVMLAYLYGNIFSDKPKEISLMPVRYSGKGVMTYLIFCLCMFGIYACLIAKRNINNALYYVTVATLFLIPFFKMGILNDFCMCVSIVPLFLLMIFVLQFLFEHTEASIEQIKKGMLVVCLCIGMMYPVIELYGCIRDDDRGKKQTEDYFGSLASFADRNRKEISMDLRYNYYAYDLENNLFVKYVARSRK